MNLIRAIDPGPTKSAYVDWDGSKIRGFGIFENIDSYDMLDDVPYVVIEMMKNNGHAVGDDVHQTSFWVGRFWEQYTSKGCGASLMYRYEVKVHLCGSVASNDSKAIRAIVDRFDPHREFGKYGKGIKSNPGPFFGFSKDVWQAFALALTYWDKEFGE